ncbi:MAG: hypothetical protein UY50_C0009G0032 [Parcubacteria group bacterium GW2011_GWA2_49_9]|nr:MAG: hypothetical protein UY50_C0009G0032 [Parcubacteria group bacterium GW2011_GWA2_49_9]
MGILRLPLAKKEKVLYLSHHMPQHLQSVIHEVSDANLLANPHLVPKVGTKVHILAWHDRLKSVVAKPSTNARLHKPLRINL